MKIDRLRSLVGIVAIVAVGCTSAGASPSPAAPSMGAEPIAGGLLDLTVKAGKVRVSTDPQYPPQSELTPAGTYEGFDIDVATEIADRLGVEIEFTTPSWDLITAGSWGGRWDMSVGSMTITSQRQAVLDFSPPYYYTPAQMAASTASGITTLDGLAGKTICVGEATTYLDWLNGALDFGTEAPTTTAPSGAVATTQTTDRLCAESWKAGRRDWDGWLSSLTTVQAAIDDGLPLVAIGDPVFFEPLAVSLDKSGPDTTDFLARVTEMVNEMHADGTLSGFSTKWFGSDLTKKQGG